MGEPARGYDREHETLARQIGADAAPRVARWLGSRHPRVRGRREGDRHPQGVEQGRRTRSRPRSPGCSAARPTSPARPPSGSTATTSRPSSRRARAGRQLHYGIREHESAAISNGLSLSQAAPVLVHLPHLLRLRAPGDPPLGADGTAGDPHLHPRLDRPRRGRPDPSAGRAARLAARDSRAQRDPPCRRQRGRRGLARGDGPTATSRPPSCSRARTCPCSIAQRYASADGSAPGRLCAGGRRRRRASPS